MKSNNLELSMGILSSSLEEKSYHMPPNEDDLAEMFFMGATTMAVLIRRQLFAVPFDGRTENVVTEEQINKLLTELHIKEITEELEGFTSNV